MIDLDIPKDGWLCVWTQDYESNVKLIESREEAIEYFIEDIGFDKEDIAEILELEDSDYWEGDPSGLKVFKMNKRD